MTRICVPSHSCQQTAQIRASIAAPSEPGSPTFPAPSRSSPHRAQCTITTWSMLSAGAQRSDAAERGEAHDRATDAVLPPARPEGPAVEALLGAVAEDDERTALDRGAPPEDHTLH